MNNKQRVILLFLILFFGFLFFYSVRIGFQGKLSDISLDIRDIKKSLTIEPDLRIQNYFLKVKFFKDENSEFSVNTFVNGNRIESFKKKEKSDYVKLHFIINKDLLKPSGNIIRFEFEKKLPTSIFINIANYYKRLTHDLVIFPSYIDMPRHRGWVVFVLISLFLFSILWFILYLFFSKVLKVKFPFRNVNLTLSPFLIACSIFSLSRLSGYRIIMSPFIFWFMLIICVFLILFIYTVSYLKGRISRVFFKFNLKNLIFSLAISIFVFVLFYSLCEFSTRAFNHFYYPKKIFKIVKDKNISYELNPGVEVKFADGLVKINKGGYRGEIIPVQKNKNRQRIILVGDSIVFGFGLNEDQTLPYLLSKLTDKEKPVEILNLAVTGYNLHQEMLYFKENGIKYSPDILIYGYCINDVGGNIYTPTSFNTLLDVGDFNYRYEDFSLAERLQFNLMQISSFYQYLVYKWRVLLSKNILKESKYSSVTMGYLTGQLNERMKDALDMYREDLLTLKNICNRNNIKLIIIAYGNQLQIDDPGLNWHENWLSNFCKDNGIYYLNLLPAFKGYSKDDVFIDEGHPSSLGNKILSGYLYNFLKTNNLLK